MAEFYKDTATAEALDEYPQDMGAGQEFAYSDGPISEALDPEVVLPHKDPEPTEKEDDTPAPADYRTGPHSEDEDARRGDEITGTSSATVTG